MHPIVDSLRKLKLLGMLEALETQSTRVESGQTFEEKLAFLLENELAVRENIRLRNRLKKANLKQNACMQDIDFRHARGIDKGLINSLETTQWIASHRNILIVGSTGTGKTFLGESFAHNACLKGFTAHHLKLSRLFNELALKRADGRYLRYINEISKYDVLLLDDLGVAPLTDEHRRDFLEIIDERHGKRSTIVTSQLPVKLWHEAIGDKTLADAILDRLVHNAYKIELKGESMRKLKNQPIKEGEKE